jgi:hypothetical protein
MKDCDRNKTGERHHVEQNFEPRRHRKPSTKPNPRKPFWFPARAEDCSIQTTSLVGIEKPRRHPKMPTGSFSALASPRQQNAREAASFRPASLFFHDKSFSKFPH